MKASLFYVMVIFLGLYSCRNSGTDQIVYNSDGSINKKTIYTSHDKSTYREYNYYEKGTLKNLFEYEQGVLNGRGFNYYANGNIQSVFYYNDGKLNSIARYYDENGRITDKGLFINDSLIVKEEFYYKNGLTKVNVFSKITGEFNETGALLFNNKGLFGLDNSSYFVVSSLDSIPSGDSLKVNVYFIEHNNQGSHISLYTGLFDENLYFSGRGDTYKSDSLSLSFFYKPEKSGYNLILGKLNYYKGNQDQDPKEYIFYHDFLVY